MTQTTKVLIADDHPVVRQGLRAVLSTQPDLEIVGEVEDGEKAVEFARNCKPDVVLMDVAMPVCSGEKATQRIMRFQPECKVLALSSYTDDQSVQQMLQAGVAGYLAKQSAPDELIKAIRTIRAGKGQFFSRDVAPKAQRLRQACSDGRAWKKSLTALESQVLKLIATGLTTRMIAPQLHLTEAEVSSCRERVMNKLDVRNVAGLTRYAVANRLVPLNETAVPEAKGANAPEIPVWSSSAAAHN